jgi:molybdopterin synthase catalytic subunit
VRFGILHGPFDPAEALRRHQRDAGLRAGSFGAMTSFVGTMREFNDGDAVTGMMLEHYPGMTERYLEKISREAANRWDLLDTLVLHRVGQLKPGDPIVLVAVWSAHRAAAFDACRYLLEALKSQAPFWKKEAREADTRWVEKNTPG